MWSFAARLNLARLTCLLLYSLVFEWRGDEQPQFLAIFSTLTRWVAYIKGTSVHALFLGVLKHLAERSLLGEKSRLHAI